MASVQAQRKNELFSELIECIKYELMKQGMQELIAEQTAEDITFNVYEHLRGL